MASAVILHAMNTVFGKNDQYGARSRHICLSAGMGSQVEIFARGAARGMTDVGAAVHTVSLPYRYQALRYGMAVLRQKPIQRRAIWRGFDARLSRMIHGSGAEHIKILHTWEWIPDTIRVLREMNPDVKVIRDVVVNRFNEFYSGVPISEEEPFTDLFLSPSTFSTKCLLGWGIPERKIVEIPFGVDTEHYRPAKCRVPGPVRFCFSGGISKRKGADALLRVWKSLSLPDAELHLYGRVREDVAADLRGAANVVCHGHIPLSEELPRNDVYVFPSTLEGSAKSVYEALACGLPVITTPNAGSVIRDGIDGFIVECGDDDALREAMMRLYQDAALRTAYGQNARSRAEEYTWDRYARSIANVYEKFLR